MISDADKVLNKKSFLKFEIKYTNKSTNLFGCAYQVHIIAAKNEDILI